MQDSGVELTADEVRDLFSVYHDRELDPERSRAVRTALEKDPELAKEYETFCSMIAGLASIGAGLHTAKPETPAAPEDLITNVQRKIHQRSRGKFYRDRWSRTAGLLPLEIIAAGILVVMVLLYVLMGSISVRPAPGGNGNLPQSPAPTSR